LFGCREIIGKVGRKKLKKKKEKEKEKEFFLLI